jgi:hypothetical protein
LARAAGFGVKQIMIRYATSIRHARRDDRAMIRGTGLGVAVGAVLFGAAITAFSAFAQDTRTEPQSNVVSPPLPVPPPVAQPPVTQPPAANYQPGFIDVFGRFIGDSAAKLNSQLKSANETLGDLGSQTSEAAKGAVGTARNAAGTIIGLPNARIVTGRERCTAAANGAPDCRAAADAACRAKGFASGRSLDTQSVQKCPARVWLSGRLPAEGECPLETFVTRAVCQ